MDEGVGATLREARNRRKIDLSQVEAATKIRVRYLRAIENEEWDLLPGDAYARAFVRAYASYLGLDAERLAEQQRRGSGGAGPAERLPRVDPRPVRASSRRRRLPSLPPRLVAAAVSVALIAALVAIGLASGGGSSGPSPRQGAGKADGGRQAGKGKGSDGAAAGARGHSLRLTATAEVWVCLLAGDGKRLVNGQILGEGEEAGPFRSGSFTVAMGNGAVEMTVDGRRARIPASSSPVGYRIDGNGSLSEIPEGERPTCT
ncbi:MAG TPA: helix-turn-helix domain-containing protein [Solirubrobacterales bacterium]|nr:helix-turn-helix domain-containing protein [Solirubrobacterales bacterium]